LGIEVCFSGELDRIGLLKKVLNKHNIPFAFNLPALKEGDLKVIGHLNHFQPEYIVTQGYVSSGESGDYMGLCDETVNILSGIGNDTKLYIKNSVYPAVGILSTELLEISWGSNCGVLIDTEHLLHTILAIREWSRSDKAIPSNDEEKECLKRYSFFVRSGKVICPLKSLKTLDLESQLMQVSADRYHISGSNTVITDAELINQAKIQDTPFHNYLISAVRKMKPTSITVKCSCLDGSHDLDVGLNSLKTLLELVSEKKLRGISR
jgi:hypothetical protein